MLPAATARRLLFLGALALAGCVGSSPEGDAAPDASFDVVSPDRGVRYDVADRASDADDALPTIDVHVYDAPALDAADSATDVSAPMDAGVRCGTIADAYAAAVQAAQVCSSSTDCGAQVCETACCNCVVFVNSAADSYAMISDLQAQWNAAGCAAWTTCPTTRCETPAAAQCSSSSRCVTLRRSPGG